MLRPFFPFYGSKWRIARRYPKPVGVVCEPFAGSASYSLYHHVEQAVLVDADPIVSGVWSWLIAATPEQVQALPDLPNVGDSVDDHPSLSDGARWLVGFWLNRGSAMPKKSRTAYSARTDGQLIWSQRAKDRICDQLPAIRGWRVMGGSFKDAPESDTTFVDPPYSGKPGDSYRVKFRRHDDLAPWCRARAGRVIVCEGADATWLPFSPLGSFKTSRGRAPEAVWTSGT